MRKILIVGAGQSGLQLALGLQRHGYDVTVVSNRTPDEIRAGKVMSSQCMFHTALQHERDLGLNLWEHECPQVEGISFAVPAPDGGRGISWAARLDRYAQSIDQRVKMPGWMEEFTRRGGDLVIHDVTVDDLERYSREYDLIMVAAGKGEIARLFDRDAARSPYDRPQRALALTYVTGLTPRPEYSAVCFNMIPGVGEYFVFPALTTTGPCEIMVFEGVPGGPMDCWEQVRGPEEHLATSLRILREFVPWEYERCRDVELTDDNGVLTGRFAPAVRKPVGKLPSGAPMLGVADVVVLNDPITGQGSNNASKCAASYLASVLAHGDRPFDVAWMEQTFERYWRYAQHVTAWTNALLTPPPPHVLELLAVAGEFPEIASRFVNGFDNPPDYTEWFMDPAKAETYLADVRSRATTGSG